MKWETELMRVTEMRMEIELRTTHWLCHEDLELVFICETDKIGQFLLRHTVLFCFFALDGRHGAVLY